MRRMLFVFLLSGMCSVGVNAAEEQAEFIKWGPASERLGGQLGAQWLSQYFFRGLRFSRNDVLQQEAAMWYGGVKARGFFNYDCGPDEYNEVDLTGSYSFALSESAAVEGGYTYYNYPHRMRGYDIKDTQEVFAGLMQATAIVDASIYGYYDFRDGSGALWEFALGKSVDIPIAKPVSVKPFVRAAADLNLYYFNNAAEFSHSILTAGLPFYLSEQFIVTGSYNYQWGWQNWVEDDWYVQAGVTIRF
jgi:hypothetical protein